MFEEVVPSLWASVNSWFTPSVLFVLVNIVIGTIAFTSKGARGADLLHGKDEEHFHSSPSVLERVKSFRGFSRTASGQIPFGSAPADSAPASDVSPHGSVAETPPETLDDAAEESPSLKKTKSESESSTKKIASKLIRSVSAMSPIRFEEKVERRWPATVRPSNPPEDEEVDAKADDFINRFRQQLKLQRLDSITKYRDMFSRGK